MENIIISPTPKTPYINFDSSLGMLEIKGKSVPENPNEFYKPIIDIIKLCITGSKSNFQVDIQLDYFNTYSAKCILDLFKSLETSRCGGLNVKINWHYEKGDSYLLEAGEDFQAMVNLPFNIKCIKPCRYTRQAQLNGATL